MGPTNALFTINESRVRHYRLSLKGGEEEKSPYRQYHIKYLIIVLDG
jgi:hypothetical protein